MLKKIQVVMLPTNEKANLHLVNENLILHTYQSLGHKENVKNAYKPQHLYFLSDEEIKEGDWMYHPLDTGLVKCDKENYKTLQGCSDSTKYSYKKIIATTDSSLAMEGVNPEKRSYSHPGGYAADMNYFKSFPQPSQSFLEVFVREYNKGNVIKEVMVEYEERGICVTCNHQGLRHCSHPEECSNAQIFYSPKVNPKDNTITIKRVKESWSREEVENLLNNAWIEAEMNVESSREVREKWIEQNL